METESFRAAARKVGILFDSKAVVRRVLSASFRPGGNLSRYGCLRGISGNLSVCLQVFSPVRGQGGKACGREYFQGTESFRKTARWNIEIQFSG